MICVIRSSVCHIIQDFLAIQTISLCHCQETNWTKSSLCIDVQTLPFTSTHANWQLTSHSQGVTELGLSSAEFTEEFSYGTCLDATFNLIQSSAQ
jgi:hypothetical protein